MKPIFEKLKLILNVILNYLKSLLIAVFGFFFDMFNNKNNAELKPIKLEKLKNDSSITNKDSDISGHNEEPNSKTISNFEYFNIPDIELEKRVLIRFCKELEIEDDNLSETEKEFIKISNKKIIPMLQNDINKRLINNEDVLEKEIKKLVITELEYQFNLEQNIDYPTEKSIVTPLVIKKDSEKNTINTYMSFVETKKIVVTLKKESKINIEIPSNNIIGTLPPINNDNLADAKSNLNIEAIETLQNSDSSVELFSLSNDSEPNIEDISSSVYNEETIDVSSDKITYDQNNSSEQDSSIIDTNNYLPNPKQQIELLEENKNTSEDTYQEYNYKKMDDYIQKIVIIYNEEVKKEELEDKNYNLLENQIDALLNEISKLKLLNLKPILKTKLINQENSLVKLKKNLKLQKQKDINLEEANLDASILNEDLMALENELKKLHMEDKIDLQNFMINNLEELDNMTFDKAKKIEKELLKIKLKKALHALEIPSLLALPFIRNKYFMFFTGGLFANRHLRFFDAILKRKSTNFEIEELSHIKTGANAFDDAIIISKQNIEYLEYLEIEAFKKHPELRFDADYIIYLNKLKNKLLKQQERLLKKESIFQKHNLKLKRKIRKLKKKENQI